MDSQQIFCYSETDTGLVNSSSHPAFSSVPSRLLESLKSDLRNSPNSSFSNHLDSDSLSTLSDSLDNKYSYSEIHSGVSPSCDSSLETTHNWHSSTSSMDYHQDGPHLYSAKSSLLNNVNCSQKIRHALSEVESSLMASNSGNDATTSNSPSNKNVSGRPMTSGRRNISWSDDQSLQTFQGQPSLASSSQQLSEVAHAEKRHKAIEEELVRGFPPSNLRQLLIACAKALSENNVKDFDQLIERARSSVSITGEPMQRLGAYLVEGLVARKEASGNNIYRSLRCKEPEGKDLLSYMHRLYEICPYLKFGYMAANGAIAEACRNEDCIHIIDFQIAQGSQWVTLLQALAARPSGAPYVRITGIDDPLSKYARGDGLEAVSKRLAMISEKFHIPVEFHGLPVFGPDVTRDMLDIRPGEALAVNFPLQLHHTADESVDVNNPRDGLLRMVKSLSPKVVTLVEQESNTNTTPFFNRFIETLDYYLAMFESIDVTTLTRDDKMRINVEQHCLARDVVNVIACEGKERVERHELFGKWKSRLTMAGFRQYPMSTYVNSVIRSLLRYYSENYTLVDKDGAMLLGWKSRNLISASAWH
ncbi:scarecrow-like protein 21 [Neltuma alba]|uniref:scarecrow-like protein 21 n=1 Tax=Neltuma alba TaxID=207710 RepID=UPI0010A349F4|nr:scarecrow-like protein 21 [Prosopis alba]XP_028807683.1 scarecrow-like protein 21 [Prosopis alba]XP_028807684.1 scarecrow-like protein 21 [Prosopis alba]XP_028807685.1 scarecrow-like protein 21 [Prosopis alba]